METVNFKTTIKCSGCVAKVTPELNEAIGEGNWAVDLQTAAKVLTVATEGVSAAAVVNAVERAGYKAEALN